MRTITILALALAVASLIWVGMLQMSQSKAADERRAEADAQRKELAGVKERLDRAGAVTPSAPPVPAPPQADAAAEKFREAVREEVKAQLAQLQGGRGPGGPGGPAGPGGPGGPGGAAGGLTTRLREKAGLDEGKATQVAQVFSKFMENMQTLRREHEGGGGEQGQAALQELQKKTEEELARVLTPDELAKVKETTGMLRGAPGKEQPRGEKEQPRGEKEPGRAKPDGRMLDGGN